MKIPQMITQRRRKRNYAGLVAGVEMSVIPSQIQQINELNEK